MMLKKNFTTEAELRSFAAHLAKNINAGCLIFLIGPLGAGKTTFARGLLRGLGYQGKVKSPTYSLLEVYELPDRCVCHCDFYRLDAAEEWEYLGLEDYFSETTLLLIEWPEKIAAHLPSPDLRCELSLVGEGRALCLHAETPKGEQLLAQLS